MSRIQLGILGVLITLLAGLSLASTASAECQFFPGLKSRFDNINNMTGACMGLLEKSEGPYEEFKTFQVLPGDSLPVTAEGHTAKGTGAVVLESEVGSTLSGEEAKVALELKTNLGPASADLVNVVEPKSKESCHTEGDAAGVVLVKGEYRVVFTSFEPLEIGLLFLFSEVTVICGKLKIKITAPILGHINPGTKGAEVTSFGLGVHCKGKGKQALTSYFNTEGKAIEKQLLSVNFGLGKENGCQEVKEELTISTSKMVEIFW